MDSSELVFNNEDGKITGVGYLIDNTFLQQGQPAAVLAQQGQPAHVMTGGSIIETLKLGDLAVPLGLFYLQDLAKKTSSSFNTSVFELYDDVERDDVKLIEESLYDKLLSMVNVEDETPGINKKPKMTRKNRNFRGSGKKTRARKN